MRVRFSSLTAFCRVKQRLTCLSVGLQLGSSRYNRSSLFLELQRPLSVPNKIPTTSFNRIYHLHHKITSIDEKIQKTKNKNTTPFNTNLFTDILFHSLFPICRAAIKVQETPGGRAICCSFLDWTEGNSLSQKPDLAVPSLMQSVKNSSKESLDIMQLLALWYQYNVLLSKLKLSMQMIEIRCSLQ